jgi:hypothetical protein
MLQLERNIRPLMLKNNEVELMFTNLMFTHNDVARRPLDNEELPLKRINEISSMIPLYGF